MSARDAKHIRSHDGSRGFFGFECQHCGSRQPMATPIELDVMLAAMRAFLKSHRHCPAPSAKESSKA